MKKTIVFVFLALLPFSSCKKKALDENIIYNELTLNLECDGIGFQGIGYYCNFNNDWRGDTANAIRVTLLSNDSDSTISWLIKKEFEWASINGLQLEEESNESLSLTFNYSVLGDLNNWLYMEDVVVQIEFMFFGDIVNNQDERVLFTHRSEVFNIHDSHLKDDTNLSFSVEHDINLDKTSEFKIEFNRSIADSVVNSIDITAYYFNQIQNDYSYFHDFDIDLINSTVNNGSVLYPADNFWKIKEFTNTGNTYLLILENPYNASTYLDPLVDVKIRTGCPHKPYWINKTY